MVFPLAKKLTREQCATIFFAVLVFLFYGNTLQNGFVQDDVPEVEKNVFLRSINNIHKAVTACVWEYANKGCEGRTFYYRPLHYLFFFLTYRFSSQPWLFHLVNLIYFFFAVYLIFIFAKTVTRDFIFALASALLFLINPINNEVVNWIAAGSEILFLIFSLLVLIFYFRYRDKGNKIYLGLVYLFYFFALLSKESAVFLPVVVFAFDWLVLKKSPKELFSGNNLKRYLFFGIPFLGYFLMRAAVIGSGVNFLGEFGLASRLYLYVMLFGKYLRKVFFPYPLQAAYDFSLTPDFSQPLFYWSLGLTILFFGVLWWAIKRQKGFLAFSLVWFGLLLAPTIIFLQAAGAGMSIFFERYLFTPAVGWTFILAYFFCRVLKRKDSIFQKLWQKIGLSIFAGMMVIICWAVVFNQNRVWRDNEILYTNILKLAPNAHGSRYPLAVLYYEAGEIEKAKRELGEIIQRSGGKWKDITMVYKGLGDCYRDEGDSETALFYYQKAVETAAPSPRDYVTFNDLGVAYVKKGNYLKGLIYFCQALQLYPEAETVSINFNGALDLIETDYRQKKLLYQKITEELALAREEKIRYLNRICGEDTCQYLFSFSSPMPEVLLPSLISAISLESAKEIYLNNPSFQLGQGVISIEIEKAFSDKELRFIFPSCSGVFYQLEVMPEADKL